MSELTCLRCKTTLDSQVEACPQCGEKITQFQRTYATRLIDGKYQILERLGLGGMGEIFKVLHIHLGEQRVIKIMRANIASDDQSLQRFLQEARTSTMIKHKNLAMLYDFSTLEDGSYYMVWEYIEGTNIQKWIALNGPMPPRLALEIAIQALRGLEALHEMGIIHRDVSPENIMLSQDHLGKLLSKVIDFGIAKQLGESESGGGHGLTQTGMFLGKLKYASPEQAGFIKEGEHLDHRSDLYSFGVVFYEMLAGRAPFLATNPHGYILKHATEKPLPISQTNPAVTVPPKLEEIVFKSLEKDRDNRFLSAEEFIRALEAIRNDVAPDAKYGVGERMMTLTARTTHMDLGRTRTGATGVAPTATRPAGVPSAPTGTQQNGATVIEKTRGSAPATMGDGATVIERTAGGASQATVVERVGGAGSQATVLEPKVAAWQQPRGSAEATVLERQVLAPPSAPKSKGLLFGGIAAAVVLVAAIGGYLALRPEPATTDIPPTNTIATSTTTPGTTAGEEVTMTATPASTTGNGVLRLITASPNASIESIFNVDTNQPVTLSSDDRSLPFYQQLAAGNYKVTIDEGGSRKTLEIRVAPGEIKEHKVKFGSPSVDDAMRELFGQ